MASGKLRYLIRQLMNLETEIPMRLRTGELPDFYKELAHMMAPYMCVPDEFLELAGDISGTDKQALASLGVLAATKVIRDRGDELEQRLQEMAA